jgi:pimeloyl-ACP methyl ester carboxylesterase
MCAADNTSSSDVGLGAGVDADHAIVVHSGNACVPAFWTASARTTPSAAWTCGNGRSLGAHVAKTTRLPVFLVGSTRMLRYLPRCTFPMSLLGVLIGDAGPPALPGQFDPSLRQNTKPVVYIIGQTDIDSWPEVAKAAAAAAGPVEMHTLPALMLSYPEACSDIVLEWCQRQLSNHLNPAWKFD